MLSAEAQVVNGGGGGPETHGEVKKEETLNPNLRAKMVETIEKDIDYLMEKIKMSWRDCYKTKLKANNMIDLYAQLTILNAGQGPKVTKKYQNEYGGENCEKSKVFACFLRQQNIQSNIQRIITTSSFHYYLEDKGIDKLGSREQLIKFYQDLISGIDSE